ncbi:Dehydrogenase [Penicillium paradoxum]|uniref:Dehydrogenase n=1 Tax=Penicillium paradoxum TaxID=176176 RepID=UPI002548CD25|nr:Dehydrogenase [Penicillium paradoxum]KAJ5788364.1 Dehydrogenase [Penicillium paradoxum]
MAFSNEAAWIVTEKARPFKVEAAPEPHPLENEVVIKVAYAAVNPTDWKMQEAPYMELQYPYILGTDVSGTIVQLGSNVTRFHLGQRLTIASHSGYQRYTTCKEILVSAVPDSLPLGNAAVLPLSISTAASALFHYLELPYPTLNPKPTGKTLLVWGGSSSVGSSAIQLGLGAGFDVIATAGSSNLEYVKNLGASAFDHRDPDVEDKILQVLKPGDVVFDPISTENTQRSCGRILGAIGGGKLPLVLPSQSVVPANVDTFFVNGLVPGLTNLDVGDAVWRNYIPQALASGKFQAKPDPLVLEGGLERVQEGVDLLKKGVSAKKIVIEIEKE